MGRACILMLGIGQIVALSWFGMTGREDGSLSPDPRDAYKRATDANGTASGRATDMSEDGPLSPDPRDAYKRATDAMGHAPGRARDMGGRSGDMSKDISAESYRKAAKRMVTKELGGRDVGAGAGDEDIGPVYEGKSEDRPGLDSKSEDRPRLDSKSEDRPELDSKEEDEKIADLLAGAGGQSRRKGRNESNILDYSPLPSGTVGAGESNNELIEALAENSMLGADDSDEKSSTKSRNKSNLRSNLIGTIDDLFDNSQVNGAGLEEGYEQESELTESEKGPKTDGSENTNKLAGEEESPQSEDLVEDASQMQSEADEQSQATEPSASAQKESALAFGTEAGLDAPGKGRQHLAKAGSGKKKGASEAEGDKSAFWTEISLNNKKHSVLVKVKQVTIIEALTPVGSATDATGASTGTATGTSTGTATGASTGIAMGGGYPATHTKARDVTRSVSVSKATAAPRKTVAASTAASASKTHRHTSSYASIASSLMTDRREKTGMSTSTGTGTATATSTSTSAGAGMGKGSTKTASGTAKTATSTSTAATSAASGSGGVYKTITITITPPSAKAASASAAVGKRGADMSMSAMRPGAQPTTEKDQIPKSVVSSSRKSGGETKTVTSTVRAPHTSTAVTSSSHTSSTYTSSSAATVTAAHTAPSGTSSTSRVASSTAAAHSSAHGSAAPRKTVTSTGKTASKTVSSIASKPASGTATHATGGAPYASAQQETSEERRRGSETADSKQTASSTASADVFAILKNMPNSGSTESVFIEGSFSFPKNRELGKKSYRLSGYISRHSG